MQLTHGSLFDGAGGLRLGFEQAGIKTLWKHDILYGQDITIDDPILFKRPDIITGGPPCQNVSQAQAFNRGKRNFASLWPHMLRFISALKPNWVFGTATRRQMHHHSSRARASMPWLRVCRQELLTANTGCPNDAPDGFSADDWVLMGWPYGITFTMTAHEAYNHKARCSMGIVPTVCEAEFLQGFPKGFLHSWAQGMQ